MKPTEFIVENSTIAQEADDMHKDHEVQMARSQMYSAAQAAIEIHRLLRDISEMEGLEGWVQSKLTLASQYLESVRDYMKYEAVSQEPEMMTFAEEAADYALESLVNEVTKDYVEKNPEKFNEPTRNFYARNTARSGGDEGLPGARSSSVRTGGDIVQNLTGQGYPAGGRATRVERPEGVPRVNKIPTTRFGGGGGGGGGMNPFEKRRSLYFEKKIREQTSTPTIGGLSRSTALGGDITTRSDIGGTSVSQTQTPGGFVKQQTADMDMGGFGTASMVKQAPQQPGQLTGTTTVTRTAAAGPKYDADAGVFGNAPTAAPATGSAVQGVGFAGAGKDVTAATPKVVTTGDKAMAQQAQNIMKPGMSEQRKSKMRESATGGGSSSGGIATSMGGPAHKATSGVPKKLGNAHKSKRVAVGKGVYDK
jgi:hypothetical protein